MAAIRSPFRHRFIPSDDYIANGRWPMVVPDALTANANQLPRAQPNASQMSTAKRALPWLPQREPVGKFFYFMMTPALQRQKKSSE
ncbi:MAG TPA: hypothetical protein VH250_10060 [Granulicella sp.]|nr:hypothetical protein [Granulicella sp.]